MEASGDIPGPSRSASLPTWRMPLCLGLGRKWVRPAEYVHAAPPLSCDRRDVHHTSRAGQTTGVVRRRPKRMRQRSETDDLLESGLWK